MSAECSRAAVRSRVSTRRAVQPCWARWTLVRRTASLSARAAAVDPPLLAGAAALVDRVACGVALCEGDFRFLAGLLDRWDVVDLCRPGAEGRTAAPWGLGATRSR